MGKHSSRFKIALLISLLLLVALVFLFFLNRLLQHQPDASRITLQKILAKNEELLTHTLADLDGDGDKELVLKIKAQDSVFIKIYAGERKRWLSKWKSPSSGYEDKKIFIEDGKTGLEVLDINRDGEKEIITSALHTSMHTNLYIYRWDKTRGEAVLLESLVSDVGWTVGEDIVVHLDGVIKVVGREYNLEGVPRVAEYQYIWDGEKYAYEGFRTLGPLWPE